MSEESGIPTYRGRGGIWETYNWEDVACQAAYDREPEKVLKFHELRLKRVSHCEPHPGYEIITKLQKAHPMVNIITQNIDGLHQKSGSKDVIELHGSIWRLRCSIGGITHNDYEKKYTSGCYMFIIIFFSC